MVPSQTWHLPTLIANLPEPRESRIETLLVRGCDALSLSLSGEQLQQLQHYLALLAHWNKTYNLTAVREEEEMVTRHLLDSLSIARFVDGRRVLDVGTGPGLPGIPLAILFPGRAVHLLDSNGKKTRFLFQVKTALGLDNISIHQARVEAFTVAERFDTVVFRAFASIADTLNGCRHTLAPGAVLLAMKGVYPAEELSAVCGPDMSIAVHAVVVPGLEEQRHLVEIRPRLAADRQQP